MFLTFKKWTALYILCLVLLFACFAAILWQGNAVRASRNLTLEEKGRGVLVIDPGHGGEDGGAVAADGTTEAEINLAISLRMEELAALLGVEAEMTRREDVSLGDAELSTIRQRKTSDLKNRVAIANSIPGGVLISIHQNTLPGIEGVHGAQVFYNSAAGSEELALSIQEALNQQINDRPKEAKRIDKSIYVLENAEGAAVLVECGFLSNPQETAQLRSADYQLRLALIILSATLCQLSPAA